jgi:MoaA/NifB/PqqE/SkfB family radical SAM enzyme
MSSLFASKSKLIQAYRWGREMLRAGIVPRVFDSRPIWAQLKITERCNLNCGYCCEHNNSGRHVPLYTIVKWIGKCSELGVKHVEFIGGEPLMHPDLFEMLKYARSQGMNTGLTTNGFLMTDECIEKLMDNGISRLQLSIDCIEPNDVSKKAFSLLKYQLEQLSKKDILLHVNSVITKDTIQQAIDLACILFDKGIPVAFSPAHDDGQLSSEMQSESFRSFFSWLAKMKHKGFPVNMPQFLIDYYTSKVNGKSTEWTCEGGCKAFYVDTEGGFRVCSHKHPEIKFEDVNMSIIRNNHGKRKGCEENCGVSCMIVNSFPFCRLGYVVKSDLIPHHGQN